MYAYRKDHEFEQEVEPTITFMVCAVPRSGSSLLCELLFDTGLAGAPTEFFNPPMMKRAKKKWGVETLDDYLRALLSKETGPNGAFGFKINHEQLEATFGDTDLRTMLPSLQLVYITRTDHVRQAVSYLRAMQTGKWASNDRARNDDPVFDPDKIGRMLGRIQEHERKWEGFFETQPAPPLRITYEELVESPEMTVLEVMRFLSIRVPEGFEVRPGTLERQADELSEEWVRRYLAGSRSNEQVEPREAAP